jgi:hypothetical protein
LARAAITQAQPAFLGEASNLCFSIVITYRP